MVAGWWAVVDTDTRCTTSERASSGCIKSGNIGELNGEAVWHSVAPLAEPAQVEVVHSVSHCTVSLAISAMDYVVGKRYLHGKSREGLGLKWVGRLPPGSESGPTWLGIDYDDKTHGKHSGTYKGVRVFTTAQDGSGAFIKESPGCLIRGISFVEALEERYGAIVASTDHNLPTTSKRIDKLALGSSGIIVEAPGLDAVKTKIGKLEKLREVGLEGEGVCRLGGTEQQREVMTQRLRGMSSTVQTDSPQPYTLSTSLVICSKRGKTSLRLLIIYKAFKY